MIVHRENKIKKSDQSRPSMLIRIVLPLVLIWIGIIAWLALDRYATLAGSIFSSNLNHLRSTVIIPARVKGLAQLYRDLNRYRQHHGTSTNQVVHGLHIPDNVDSLTLSTPSRLLPLINTDAFALLKLDASAAERLNAFGLQNQRVVSTSVMSDKTTFCSDLNSWFWPWYEFRHKGLSSNIFRGTAAGGCGHIESVQVDSVVTIWAGSSGDILNRDGIGDVETHYKKNTNGVYDATNRWMDLSLTPDNTPVFLAVGLGSGCTLFNGITHNLIRFPPLSSDVKSAHYARFIALYHFANVIDGSLKLLDSLKMVRLVNGEGHIMPGVRMMGRNTI